MCQLVVLVLLITAAAVTAAPGRFRSSSRRESAPGCFRIPLMKFEVCFVRENNFARFCESYNSGDGSENALETTPDAASSEGDQGQVTAPAEKTTADDVITERTSSTPSDDSSEHGQGEQGEGTASAEPVTDEDLITERTSSTSAEDSGAISTGAASTNEGSVASTSGGGGQSAGDFEEEATPDESSE